MSKKDKYDEMNKEALEEEIQRLTELKHLKNLRDEARRLSEEVGD